jgi:ABC-type branched-subunit amino acid transport system ATPase component
VTTLLRTEALTRTFGGVTALNAVSLAFEAGTISAVVGPNGAGKTTLLNLCSGVDRPSTGRIMLAGEEIGGLSPHRVAHLGVARTFQNARLFTRLTLAENVLVGVARGNVGLIAGMLRRPEAGPKARRDDERALELLELVGLRERAEQAAGTLPFGQQRLLEIARALAIRPRLLLLDEPAAGLSAGERVALAALVRQIRAGGVMVLLIEHDMDFVMSLADHVAVLAQGALLATGAPAAIQRNQRVVAAYLGEDWR